MNRLGIGIAALALASLGACGGSADEGPKAAPTAPTAKVVLADTCSEVAIALDALPDGAPAAADYRQLGNAVLGMLDEVEPDGAAVLTELREAVVDIGAGMAVGAAGDDLLRLRSDLRDAIGRVDSACARVGSSLG